MTITRAEAFLKKLVDAPSPTIRQSEVRNAHSILAEALTDLGFTIRWKRDPSGKTDDLLVAERPGTGKNATDPNAFITLVSHIDTVLSPTDTGPYRRVKSEDGERVYGAGIIDNKGGLAVLVESLRLLQAKTPETTIGFRVVSSPDEENGSSAWHQIYAEIGRRSLAVLGFEPALDDGSVISSRRGNRWYTVDIRGIEAHAGRCKGEEVNAAHEAARLITSLLEIRNRVKTQFPSENGLGVSLQVGHIEGGRNRHNVVCGDVTLKIDTRFSNFQERESLSSSVVEAFHISREKSVNGTASKIEYQIVDDCAPFDANGDAAELVNSLCSIISREEKTFGRNSIRPAKAGGAGDVNHMSRPGLLVLDGLGPVGGRMHTTEEYLRFETLETRSRALANWYPELISWLEAKPKSVP